MTAMKRLMTLATAARILGVSRQAIHKAAWIREHVRYIDGVPFLDLDVVRARAIEEDPTGCQERLAEWDARE